MDLPRGLLNDCFCKFDYLFSIVIPVDNCAVRDSRLQSFEQAKAREKEKLTGIDDHQHFSWCFFSFSNLGKAS